MDFLLCRDFHGRYHDAAVHHVAIATRDLKRPLAYYSVMLGLTPAPRPRFPVDGAWLDLGSTQVHLVVHPQATFRTNSAIDNNDCPSPFG